MRLPVNSATLRRGRKDSGFHYAAREASRLALIRPDILAGLVASTDGKSADNATVSIVRVSARPIQCVSHSGRQLRNVVPSFASEIRSSKPSRAIWTLSIPGHFVAATRVLEPTGEVSESLV